MAQGWEFDERDTWEPVVPDTWQVPEGTSQPLESHAPQETSAGWTDAARSDEEWADAADWGMREEARVPYLETVAAGYLGEEPLTTATTRGVRTGARTQAEPKVTTAPDAMRLARQTLTGLRRLRELTTYALQEAAQRQVTGLPARVALRSQEMLAAALADARAWGLEATRPGRVEAQRRLQQRLDSVLDQLTPRLAEQVAARVVADAVPVIVDRLRAEGRTTDRSTVDEVAAAPRRRR